MIVQQQLTYLQRLPVFDQIPSAAVHLHAGLLGNEAIQIPTTATRYSVHRGHQQKTIQPTARLALAKQHTFTPEGRAGRIAASLAAVNTAQPTELSASQWKDIVEEIEDED